MGSSAIRRRGSIVVAVEIVIVLAAPAVSRAVGPDRGPTTTRYVVRAGDTLWSIASRREPGQDPRIVVDTIARTNRIDEGTLVPGQELQLPA